MDIVIENLVKRFGNQKAVDNISLKVATGEILGFLGPQWHREDNNNEDNHQLYCS